jgi:hypothetical protein
MQKFILSFLFLFTALGSTQLLAQTEEPRQITLYVKPIESSDAALAKSIRSKLVNSLAQHGIALVESDEHADIVVGGSGLSLTTKRWTIGHRPAPCVSAVMRMINRNHVTLWSEDISSSRLAVDLSASFVDNVSHKIEEAVAIETRRVNNEPVVAKK